MANFFQCAATKAKSISDVVSVGNATTTCHLCNISLRLGRERARDPSTEQFADDDQTNARLSRKQWEGCEIATGV